MGPARPEHQARATAWSALACQGSVRDKAEARGMTPTALPTPSKHHATCAWCRREQPTIVALSAHVDEVHLEGSAAATSSRLARPA